MAERYHPMLEQMMADQRQADAEKGAVEMPP
jgi:hypothetical protein